MRGLGIFTWFGYRIPVPERLRLIREAGFDTVMHWWDDSFAETDGFTKEAQAELIRREGLCIENAHLQTNQVNDLWLDSPNGEAALARYLADIDGLAECGIPVAVLHTTSGICPPEMSRVGIKRFRMLADRAEQKCVKLALENVRHTDRLVTVLDTITSPALGFCYDSGHDFVWSDVPYALLARYQGRLFAVHLHDNNGQNDDHLAPGTGAIDWGIVRNGIEESSYQGAYTLEGDGAAAYPAQTPQAHLAVHYQGARAMLYGNE